MSPAVNPVSVLLDDQTARANERRSRLYQSPCEQLTIDGPKALADALARMQTALEEGLHAVMLFDYELGIALQGLARPAVVTKSTSQILLFDRVRLLTADEVDAWLQSQDSESLATVSDLRSNIDQTGFDQAVQRIHEHIANGETYQVNFCFAMGMTVSGSPVALYRELRKHQSVPYGALIHLGDGRSVLSRSPELFVRHRDGWLESQPMKGTAAVGSNLDLANDPKNRAENVMIVDLLRNDLGQVAVPGTVTVPERFVVKPYGNVLQMTSTVRARLRPKTSWLELLEAIFPCGSITGAPKRNTMRIIGELEQAPRGLYTGAIGWAEPTGAASAKTLGEFCLSVPIRTLTLSAPDSAGQRAGILGVGAGITWGSEAAAEFEECALKSRFLTQLAQPLTLFETMRANRAHGIAHLERHLARLKTSANKLGFRLSPDSVRHELQIACAALPDDGDYRMRLDLATDGTTSIKTGALKPLPSTVKVLLAREVMQSGDIYLQHKTSNRAIYDAAWQRAEAQGAFDMLFFNERDELTEGGRSNVFVKIDGRWYTPPLAAGVLPGVMRGVLLEDTELDAAERTITRGELQTAQAVLICNALRGAVAATIVD